MREEVPKHPLHVSHPDLKDLESGTYEVVVKVVGLGNISMK